MLESDKLVGKIISESKNVLHFVVSFCVGHPAFHDTFITFVYAPTMNIPISDIMTATVKYVCLTIKLYAIPIPIQQHDCHFESIVLTEKIVFYLSLPEP